MAGKMKTDGAQDEAPRYPKTLATAVDLFHTLNLDVLLPGMNVAGLSAFNPVERRIAPLSHDLAAIILPHDHFENQLDGLGKATDVEMEEKNFQKAADEYPVNCRAVPIGCRYEPPTPDPVWVAKHCQQSRYCLQIVKCKDQSC